MNARRRNGPTRTEEVANELEAEILRRREPVGTRLGLRTELMARFDVGPSTINEALRMLRERNLVTVRPGPNGGVFVADDPPGIRLGGLDLWFQGLTIPPLEIFESRALLEDVFNGLARERATPEDLHEMALRLRAMETAGPDPRAFFQANVAFHLAIARASRVSVLVGLYSSLVALLTGALVRASYRPGWERGLEHNLRVHGELLDAIRSGDARRVAIAAEHHRSDMVRPIEPERGTGT